MRVGKLKQAVAAAVLAAVLSTTASAFATPPCSAGHSAYPAVSAVSPYVNSYDKSAVILAVPVGVPVAKVTGIVYSFDSASAAYVQQSAETIKSDEEKRIDRIYEGIKKRQERDIAVSASAANPLRIQYCAACHSAGNAKGGFRIDGELTASEAAACIDRILEDDDAVRMPRKIGHLEQVDNLPADALGKLIKELNGQKGGGGQNPPVASRPSQQQFQAVQPQIPIQPQTQLIQPQNSPVVVGQAGAGGQRSVTAAVRAEVPAPAKAKKIIIEEDKPAAEKTEATEKLIPIPLPAISPR